MIEMSPITFIGSSNIGKIPRAKAQYLFAGVKRANYLGPCRKKRRLSLLVDGLVEVQ